MRFEDYNLRMLREHQKFQGERGLRCQSLDEPCGKHVGGSFLRSALTETTAADHMSILEIGTRVLAGMSLLQNSQACTTTRKLDWGKVAMPQHHATAMTSMNRCGYHSASWQGAYQRQLLIQQYPPPITSSHVLRFRSASSSRLCRAYAGRPSCASQYKRLHVAALSCSRCRSWWGPVPPPDGAPPC